MSSTRTSAAPRRRVITLVGGLLLGTSCVTVQPGQAALVTNVGGVYGPLQEGVHVVAPFADSALFDLRQQERNEALTATTADGAEIEAGTSLITYRLVPEELLAFARDVGPDFYRVVIRPVVSAHTRRVLGGLRLDELDTEHLRAAQAEITQGAAADLRPFHLLLGSVDLRDVAPRAALVREGYEGVAVLEQRVAQAADQLRLAREHAAQLRARAKGIADANAAIAPTLDANALAEARERAFEALLKSPNTTVVTEGDASLELSP